MQKHRKERWKEDTDEEQDVCWASGCYLTIMLSICLRRGKWDLSAASGSNRCCSTRTCVCVLEPSAALATGTVIKARLWGAASATQLEPQPIREEWQRRWARGQWWQTCLSDFVWLTLPLVNQKDEFYFGPHGLASSLSVKTTSMVSHCFIRHLATVKTTYLLMQANMPASILWENIALCPYLKIRENREELSMKNYLHNNEWDGMRIKTWISSSFVHSRSFEIWYLIAKKKKK